MDELAQTFRGEYGRLCTLAARALAQGHKTLLVTEAASGRGQGIAPVYTELRNQRRRLNELVAECKANGITDSELVRLAHGVRTAIEGEWDRPIPTMV